MATTITSWKSKMSDFNLVALLKDCSKKKNLQKGTQLHEDIVKGKDESLLQKNPYVACALINMYAKCGMLTKAQELHESLHVRRVVSWNALIAGYVQHGQFHRAFDSLEQMQREGLMPNPVTFICMLKACGKVVAIDKGKEFHEDIVRKRMLKGNIELGTALVDMYAKCDAITKAQQVHDELDSRNVVSWSALISGYVRNGQYYDALDCFDRMQTEDDFSPNGATFTSIIKACGEIGAIEKGSQVHEEVSKGGFLEKNIVVGNALIDMYSKFGLLDMSWEVLEKLYFRDVVSWSTLMDGYIQQGKGHKALNCYEQMQYEGLSPDAAAFTCILKACGGTRSIDIGKQVNEEIVKAGFLQKNVVVGSALVDMYIKCGMLTKAQQVLEELPIRNVVSWSSLISGYVQEGQGHDALCCFERMRNDGLLPDSVTFSSILKACGSVGAIEKGKEIHDEIMSRNLLEKDAVLATSLVDMYARCGVLAKAYQVFEELPLRNVVSWSALISGYAQHGQAHEAIIDFQRMEHEDGFSPDSVSLLCILNACRHSGLSDEAEKYFGCMETKYGIAPNLEHHTCMVVIFGCAGYFEKAMTVIKAMPTQDYPPVWIALLRACRRWGNVMLGRLAFDHLMQLDDRCVVAYTLMANIYGASGMHEDVAKIEAMKLKHYFEEAIGN